jgi:membrane protein
MPWKISSSWGLIFILSFPYGYFFYIFLPNKKLDIKAATVSGIIDGSIYQITQMAYLNFQIGVYHNNAIYGSFVALPMFLAWLYFLLYSAYGVEITFSWENTEALEMEDLDYSSISIRIRKFIIQRLVLLCVKLLASKQAPVTDVDISTEMKIPLKIVRMLLEKLIDSDILLEVNL